jgi:hypothetical protein
MPIEQTWRAELNPFYSVEMKQWERIARMRPILRKVPDIHGREAYTDDQLFTYLEQFRSDFAASPARVIHACEGGAVLGDIEVMRLHDAVESFCTREIPGGLFATTGEPFSAAHIAGGCAAVRRQLEEVRQVRQIAVEMTGLLKRLVGLVEQPAAFNRIISRVDDLRLRMRRLDTTYKLVVNVSQLAELRRYSADRRIGAQDHETPATARRRLRRDQEFVEALIDGCNYLEELLPEVLARLEGETA